MSQDAIACHRPPKRPPASDPTLKRTLDIMNRLADHPGWDPIEQLEGAARGSRRWSDAVLEALVRGDIRIEGDRIFLQGQGVTPIQPPGNTRHS